MQNKKKPTMGGVGVMDIFWNCAIAIANKTTKQLKITLEIAAHTSVLHCLNYTILVL